MKFTTTTLPSGLRVITAPMADSPTVTVLTLVSAGSKYETKDISGLSHFLEHMCFKGTTHRPTTLAITEELDSIGSHYNAFTGQEYTGYYAKAERRHFEKVLDVVSDIYLNPLFDEREIEKEKGVIVDEISMYEDMPHRQVHDLWSELLYGDQPAGWNIAGTKDIVRSMTREQFIAYRAKHYVAEGTIVVVAGGIDEKAALDRVEQAFAGIPRAPKAGKPAVTESQKEPGVLVHHKPTDQTHLVLGVRTLPVGDERRSALSVLSGILGGGMSSRLFQKLRNEMGVGYYVRADSDLYTDHGYLAISTGVDNGRVFEVVEAILAELRHLRDAKVTEDELSKVKEYLVGTMYLDLESSDSIANFYGGEEVLGLPPKTPDEVAARIRAVTADDVRDVAKLVLKDAALNLALIGPFGDPADFKNVLRLA